MLVTETLDGPVGRAVDATLQRRPGTHDGPFWRAELPMMIRWAFDARSR